LAVKADSSIIAGSFSRDSDGIEVLSHANLRISLPGLPSPIQSFLPFLRRRSAAVYLSRCGGTRLTRLMSRVSVVRSEDSRLDDLADPSFAGDLDENDPKSLAAGCAR